MAGNGVVQSFVHVHLYKCTRKLNLNIKTPNLQECIISYRCFDSLSLEAFGLKEAEFWDIKSEKSRLGGNRLLIFSTTFSPSSPSTAVDLVKDNEEPLPMVSVSTVIPHYSFGRRPRSEYPDRLSRTNESGWERGAERAISEGSKED